MDIEKKKAASIRFFSWWSRSYDNFIFRFWMLYVIRKVRAELAITNSSDLLDVGCGTGDMLAEVADVVAEGKLVGVDLSPEMLSKAIGKLGNRKNISFFQQDILDFQGGPFDYAVSTEAFHHFVEPPKSIEKMASLLESGGKLVIADINFKPLWLWNVLWKLEPGFVKMYAKKEFKKMFEDAGLEVVKQKRLFVVGLMTVGVKKSKSS